MPLGGGTCEGRGQPSGKEGAPAEVRAERTWSWPGTSLQPKDGEWDPPPHKPYSSGAAFLIPGPGQLPEHGLHTSAPRHPVESRAGAPAPTAKELSGQRGSRSRGAKGHLVGGQ